ncbi:MAG: hypothetical protein COB73_04230 [Flavobacteriaceae bacterium]|nr:MAG: hypothetical protein COB73_04230 [Flavobacteriaceae bacterium]
MIDSFKNYLEKRLQLIKLELIGVFANMASGLVSSFIILIFLLFILMMLSFSLALYFSKLVDSFSLGFLIVATIYLGIFFLYLLIGKSKIDKNIKDAIVESALNQEEKQVNE